jgi:tripartite-type tricarboxylate transporter receptor subunit TctC
MRKRAAALVLLALFVVSGLLVERARAEWPDRTITIIVPFPPGGPNDLLGRVMAAELAPALGQNVIVENRAGGNGNTGITAAARAAPDGHTLLIVTGVVLINPSVSHTAYDPLADLAPIAYLGASPNALITRPASGIASVADLIARAKAEPGKLTFATAGIGSVSQLAVELLKLRAGIDLVHVPFNGAAPSLQAAIAGSTDIASVSIGGLVGYIQSGALRALVQTGKERWPDLPDVPTMEQAGIPNAVIDTSVLFFAPAGTPAAIVERLTRETRRILEKPEVREKMTKASFGVKYEGPDALRARMVREIPMWKELVERAGIARP